MPIVTKAIGAKLKSCETDVSRRRILAFSAGIGATFERHFNDLHADGLVAFPTLCAMFEHALLSNGFEDGINPTNASLEEMRRGVHASQDTTFHAPIVHGLHVRANGRIVAIEPTPAGCLMKVHAELVDTRSQRQLVTSWISLLFRDTGTIGTPGAVATPPELPSEAIAGEASVHVVKLPIALTFAHVYTECANIWNPIHTERRAAKLAGLPQPILHGTAVWSLAILRIVETFCDGDGTRVQRATVSFRAMVLAGTEATLRFARNGNWISYNVHNAADEIALSGMIEIA